MTLRHARAAFAMALIATVMLATALHAGDTSRARELCYAYVLEFVTGEVKQQVNREELVEKLKGYGYDGARHERLSTLEPVGRPGDVLLIGNQHAAIWVTPTILNHLNGETEAELLARSWTIADFAAFTRTRNPATGERIRVTPYAAEPVEIWSPPTGWKWRVPPRVYLEPRCGSRNPKSGLQCRELASHGGQHIDWAQDTWGSAAVVRDESGQAVSPGAVALDETDGRISLLLQNARIYREQRNWGVAVDALEEATRLAGGRPKRSRPGGPHSERVLREVSVLRAYLAREGDAIDQAMLDTHAGQEPTRRKVASIHILVDRVGPEGGESSDPARLLAGQVDAARDMLALQKPFVPPGAGDLRQIVAEIRASADSICQANDTDSARTPWEAMTQQSFVMADAAVIARRWWKGRRGDDGPFDLGITTLQGIRMRIAELAHRLGVNDHEFVARLGELRAPLEDGLKQFEPVLERLIAVETKLEAIAGAYDRTGELGHFGEERAALWRQSFIQLRSAYREDIATCRRLSLRLDDLAALQAHPEADRLRRAAAALKARLESIEREVLKRDGTANAILAADGQVQTDKRRADQCLQTLAGRLGIQPGFRSANPDSQRPPQPAQRPPVATAGQTQPAKPSSTPMQPPQKPVAPTAQPPADVPVSQPAVDPITAGGIRIQGGTTRIRIGQRVQFIATDYGNRPYATDVVWTSLREDFLSIDGQGWATGLQPGKLTIVARYGDDMPASIEVEVVDGGTPAGTQLAGAATGARAGAAAGGFTDYGGTPRKDPAEADAGGTAVAASGGFTDYGGRTRADPAGTQADADAPAGQVGRTGAGQPDGSQPGSGFTFNAASRTAIAAGQPAAWHIFATGSRLGWAGGLSRYSVGPADASIVANLQVAGEHAMWANRESRPPALAWPGWANMQASFRSWGDNLQRNPSNDVRRQLAVAAGGNISGYAQALNYRTVDTTGYSGNCDAFYVQLGFHLAYGAQVMRIADEAMRNGDRGAAQERRAGAISHLNTANSLLNEYERIKVASGRCADLREVRGLLQRLFSLNLKDVSAQALTATAAWELANERVAALGGAAPGAQRAEPATSLPMPPVQRPRSAAAAAPSAAVPPGSDPGDVKGEWLLCFATRQPRGSSLTAMSNVGLRRCLDTRTAVNIHFAPDRPDEVHSVSETPEGFAVLALPGALNAGKVVARLTRTGRTTYAYHGFDGDAEMEVEGDIARIFAPANARGLARGGVKYWVRRTPVFPTAATSFVTLEPYGPERLPADLSRFTQAEFGFNYSGLNVERTTNDFITLKHGNFTSAKRLSSKAGDNFWIGQSEIMTGTFTGSTYSTTALKNLPELGGSGVACTPYEGLDIRSRLDVQIDMGGNRISRIRLEMTKTGRPDKYCLEYNQSLVFEAADIPYLAHKSTPSWLMFEFPTSPGQTACSKVVTLAGGGKSSAKYYSTDPTPRSFSTWKTGAFDCQDGPGRIRFLLHRPESPK